MFTHLKLRLADAIHNFKWVNIIQIGENGSQRFWNLADWCHVSPLYWKAGIVLNEKKTIIIGDVG